MMDKMRIIGVCAACVLALPAAQAATTWTDWTTVAVGAPGSASGSVSGVTVSYSGQVINYVANGASDIWNPSTSFVGGNSTVSPDVVGDDIRLNGGFTGTNTVSFGSSVVDPLIAIWSLGQPGFAASFTFDATPTLQVGGPNSIYGGSSLDVAGTVVSGREGNGVVQFMGTFTSISWTNTPENYYAFTVGINGLGDDKPPQVPEPGTLVLLGLGLAGLGLSRRRLAA